MAKLIKGIIVLAILAGAVVLGMRYLGGTKSASPTAQTEKQSKDGMQVQEKYGFAPVGDGH